MIELYRAGKYADAMPLVEQLVALTKSRWEVRHDDKDR
jgi:hypothetical protein